MPLANAPGGWTLHQLFNYRKWLVPRLQLPKLPLSLLRYDHTTSPTVSSILVLSLFPSLPLSHLPLPLSCPPNSRRLSTRSPDGSEMYYKQCSRQWWFMELLIEVFSNVLTLMVTRGVVVVTSVHTVYQNVHRVVESLYSSLEYSQRPPLCS